MSLNGLRLVRTNEGLQERLRACALLHGVMAITRKGLPEPPTIFSGAAITMAPVGGS
jgi:hypothetical protein